MYVALGGYFLVLMNRHRPSVVGVHFFLLAVLLLATGTISKGGWICSKHET